SRAEQCKKGVGVARREILVEGTLIDGLGEQLGDVAATVGLHSAMAEALAGEAPRAFEIVISVRVGIVENVDGDAQLAAVVERGVMLGDARRPDVHMEAGIELAGLRDAICGGLAGEATRGPTAAAGAIAGLQDRAVIARLLQLIGGSQAGDA